MSRNSILLVDDEDSILYALEKDLKKEGYSTICVNTGEKAIKELEKSEYDLIISDLVLGGLNGIEVLKAAKKKSDAPLIIITGHGEYVSALQAFRLGAFDYLEKPCSRGVFISKVKSAIRQDHESKNLNQKMGLIENKVKKLQFENSAKNEIVNLLKNNQSALEKNLSKKNRELQNKTIALTEVLGQLEIEKENLKLNLMKNLEKFVFPILTKLEKINKPEPVQLKLLESALKNLASSFGVELSKTRANLSQKEIDICHMIRFGLSTKEISDSLNISRRTVDTHRANIRKKLKISNEKVNLSNFLRNI